MLHNTSVRLCTKEGTGALYPLCTKEGTGTVPSLHQRGYRNVMRKGETTNHRCQLLAGSKQHLSVQELAPLHLLQWLRRPREIRQRVDAGQRVRNGVRHQRHGEHLRHIRCARRRRYGRRPARLLSRTHVDSRGRVGCQRQHSATTDTYRRSKTAVQISKGVHSH